MRRAPNIWTLGDLTRWASEGTVMAGLPDGRWVIARPAGLYSLRNRVRAAWLAFTGKADVVTWEGDQ